MYDASTAAQHREVRLHQRNARMMKRYNKFTFTLHKNNTSCRWNITKFTSTESKLMVQAGLYKEIAVSWKIWNFKLYPL